MSDRAEVAMTWIEKLVRDEIEKHELFLATATAVSDGKIAITRIGAASQEKYYGRIAGSEIAVDDTVVMQRLGHDLIVLGRLQYTEDGASSFLPLTGGTITGPLIISNDVAGGFVIEDASGGTDLVFWDTDAWVQTIKGATTIGKHTSGTETYRLDAQTGAASFVSVNTPVMTTDSDAWVSGSRPSNSTTTYSTAVSSALVLPVGTWSVYAWGVVSCYNAGNQFLVRATIDGVSGTAQTSNISSDDYLPVFVSNEQLAVSGNRSITIAASYRPVTGGNVIQIATAQINAIARRVP